MADAARRIFAAKRARESNNLTYGHFGTCTYDEKRKEWNFLRQYVPPLETEFADNDLIQHDGTEFVFDLLEDPVRVLSQAIPTSTVSELGGTLNANAFIKFLPQSASGFAEFKDALRVDNAHNMVTENAGNAPYANSMIFSQAAIIKGGGRRKREASKVPILAYIMRQDPLKLKVALLGRAPLRDTESVFGRLVEVPYISVADTGIWASTSGVIQQVTSSDITTDGTPNALAVRTLTATVLLTTVVPGVNSVRSSSMLQPSVVVTIPCQYTGGSSHADIAFQPQRTDCVAIVDTTGNWSIWQVEGRRSYTIKAHHQARLLASRSLYTDYQKSNSSKILTYPDGWHKTCWLADLSGSFDRLLVCNRYFACIYDTHGKTKGEVNIRMNVQNIRDSVLDVKSTTSSAHGCFILTTSALLWMSTDASGINRKLDDSGLFLIGSWNHFRAHSDVGLCMHLLDHSHGTFIMLSTNASPILTMYHISRSSDQDTRKQSFSDPLPIELSPTSYDQTAKRNVEALEWIETSDAPQESQNSYFKIFFSDTTGSISEAIYQVENHSSRISTLNPLQILSLPPKDLSLYRSQRFVESEESEDFAVEDVHRDRGSDSHSSLVEDSEKQSDDGEVLQDTASTRLAGEMTSFQQFVQQLEKLSNTAKSLRLLSELSPDRPYIDEIEENSDQLTTLLKTFTTKDNQETPEDDLTTTTPPNQSPQLITFEPRTLLEIYESLLQTHLTPLPPATPIRNRMSTERQCRQRALSTFLSNHAIHPKIWVDPTLAQRKLQRALITTQENEQQDSDSDLSDRARRRKERKAKAREGKLEKQLLRKKAVLEAASSLPVIVSSQMPIREVKSSQGGEPLRIMSSQGGGGGSSIGGGGNGFNMPGIASTQPERGAHGSRTVKKVKKKARVPGFN